MLDIVARAPPSWGLLMQQCLANVSVDRLALACDGYIVMTATLVELLRRDGLRLEIVETLSRDELCVLAYLGAAMSNRCIAEKSGMLEDRVKAMTRSLTRKLHLKNRTTLAVFAVENEVLLSLVAARRPNSPDRVPRIRSNLDAND